MIKILCIAQFGRPSDVYIDSIISWLDIENAPLPIVEIGCGYGTFTVPIAKRIQSKIICYDIEDDMIRITKSNLEKAHLSNYELITRDVLDKGINQEANSAGVVLLFNLLHFSERHIML